jgi:hypothetical protein
VDFWDCDMFVLWMESLVSSDRSTPRRFPQSTAHRYEGCNTLENILDLIDMIGIPCILSGAKQAICCFGKYYDSS